MKQKQPDNTAPVIIIVVIVMVMIMLYFGYYAHPNSHEENLFNCLLDGNSIESCTN